MLNNLMSRLARFVTRATTAAPRAASGPRAGRQRRSRRVPVGLTARLNLHGAAPLLCVVLDASTTGVCLVTSEPIQPGTFCDIEIPFNNQRLKAGIRVQWLDGRPGQFKVGGSLLLGANSARSILQDFALYLSWRAAHQKAGQAA